MALPQPDNLPDPPEYLPFRSGTFRQTLGMKGLRDSEWIELDRAAPSELALKRSLLADHRSAVFVATERAWASSHEAVELLCQHLIRYLPKWYATENGQIVNRITGERWPLPDATLMSGMHPLELAARLVQEDWCVLDETPQGLKLSAGCVCFPSRWCVSEKIGMSVSAIHGPVPLYDAHIGLQTDQFLDRLTVDRPVWRVNWSLHDGPNLFRPDAPPMWPEGELPVSEVPTKVWLRVERQTLRRLPASGAVLFGIRTHIRPLSDLADRPEVVAALAAAVAEWPPEVVAYKGCMRSLPSILRWLELSANRAVG
ncbi:heme-dependent oxidative N-demethylase family protein [Humisphaera borealis]|uniref:DUF3445 domain-containing protein n=1 Tax=Humisphaera borealis TaxID=2807512 RepID=A0A7M2X3S9_9BACT|nr:DUF3445 domain-containing protein [Humisphaera borealis]QOV92289.1 DUF3445 domain-containing protein [Humisphaera borealis]